MVNYNDGALPVSIVEAHLSYCPDTGVFRTKTNRRNIHTGDVVGAADRQGYLVTTIFKKPLKLHRAAWAITHGEWPNGSIDHINGNKSDNRIANLRVVTNSQNKQNITKPENNTSGLMGVSFHKASMKWRATIKLNGKSTHIGLFESTDAAYSAYLDAKRELHPFNEVLK